MCFFYIISCICDSLMGEYLPWKLQERCFCHDRVHTFEGGRNQQSKTNNSSACKFLSTIFPLTKAAKTLEIWSCTTWLCNTTDFRTPFNDTQIHTPSPLQNLPQTFDSQQTSVKRGERTEFHLSTWLPHSTPSHSLEKKPTLEQPSMKMEKGHSLNLQHRDCVSKSHIV